MQFALTLLLAFLLASPATAGTWTTNQFVYKPALGARGQTEKNTFDSGMDRVDAHLGKYKTLGDPGYATLAEALTTIGANEFTLVIPAGTVNIATNTTIPANVHLRVLKGGKFSVANSVTLTISGPFEAGRYQVFTCTGTGKVEFAKVYQVWAEWWGAVGDDSTDNAAAINTALTAMNNKGIVKLSDGTFQIASTLVLKASLQGTKYRGSNGDVATSIKAAAGFSGTMMIDLYNGSGSNYYCLSIKKITIDSNTVSGVMHLSHSSSPG